MGQGQKSQITVSYESQPVPDAKILEKSESIALYGSGQALQEPKKAKGSPIPPTHVFRDLITDLYDFGKGATDLECKQVFQATKGRSLRVPFTQSVAMRMLYFPVVDTVRAMAIHRAVDSAGGIDGLRDRSLPQFRRSPNRKIMNDSHDRLGQGLFTSGHPIGALVLPKKAAGTQGNKTPQPIAKITATFPGAMREYLYERCGWLGRQPGPVDFLGGTGIVLDESAFSPSTPDSLKGFYCQASSTTACAFQGHAQAELSAKTRLSYWLTPGMPVISSQIAAHPKVILEPVQMGSKRPPCFWCWKRFREMNQCLFCGEILCAKCWTQFHSFTPSHREVPEGEPDDGDMDEVGTEAGTSTHTPILTVGEFQARPDVPESPVDPDRPKRTKDATATAKKARMAEGPAATPTTTTKKQSKAQTTTQKDSKAQTMTKARPSRAKSGSSS